MTDPTPPPLPAELPVLPLRRTVAFPLTLQPLAVSRPGSIESINRALAADRLILLLLQDREEEDPTPEGLRAIGTVGIIRQMAKAGGTAVNIIIEGVARIWAEDVTRDGIALRARIRPCRSRLRARSRSTHTSAEFGSWSTSAHARDGAGRGAARRGHGDR